MPNIIYLLFRRLRLPLVVLTSVYAIIILGFVLIPGVDDQGNPWRMDFFHAFYFVSFMGTTIGFGEIPYAFTESQRMWTLVGLYATVTAWLYGIGALLTTIQNPAFKELMAASSFKRRIKSINTPFYVICGYGDTGSQLVQALAEEGIHAVVIDNRQDKIQALELSDLPIHVPHICADASHPDILQKAGINTAHCAGIVAITSNDEVNLTIALTAHLMKPDLTVIARAETTEAEANITSFGANEVINPFETFAGRLALALHSPGTFVLHEWMTGVPHEKLHDPLFPPRGEWVLCGYGRFGHAMYERLISEGITTRIIEATPDIVEAPEHTIHGKGTEAQTLRDAGILNATGIVAGTNDDADNLSILITARDLNPNLFMVARQNKKQNDMLFRAANLDLVMRRGSVIAHKIYAFIRTPLLSDFLISARQNDNEWANTLVARISGIVTDEVPHIWEIEISPDQTPAFYSCIRERDITLLDLRRDPRNRDKFLSWIPLLLKRDSELILLPDESIKIEINDRILLCGREESHRQMEWVARNCDVLAYVLTGDEHPSSYLGKWMARFGSKSSQTATVDSVLDD